MSLQNYLSKLKKIADNAKDISPFAPMLERKAVTAVGEDITAIGTFEKISLVGSREAISKLTKEELPNLKNSLVKGIAEVDKKHER